MKRILALVSLFILLTAMRGDLPAYQIFNEKGKSSDFGKLLNAAADADVVLFGELHNNPISHWLQLELTKALYNKKNGRR